MKEELLNEYVENGELSGGEVASILNDQVQTDYYGIERQALYDQNKQAFLGAIEKEVQILNRLYEIEDQLKKEASHIFSPQVSNFKQQWEDYC